MKWIPLIAVGIYVISMLLVLFLGNRVKGTSQDKKNTEKNPIVFRFYVVYILIACFFVFFRIFYLEISLSAR